MRDMKKPGWVRQLILFQGKTKVLTFSVTDAGEIFLIDVHAKYSTNEGVGPGSRLAHALETYGAGQLEPTEQGYLVSFASLRGVSFLLDGDDIPRRLRAIPDDVFTQNNEKALLSLGDVAIVAVQFYNEN